MPLKKYSRYVAMFAVSGTAAMGTAHAVQPAAGAPVPAVPAAQAAPAAPASPSAPAPVKAAAPAAAPAPAPAPIKSVAPPPSFLATESVSLNGSLAAGDFKLLADITPFRSVRGHVALKAPCTKKAETPLVLLAGVAPAVAPVNLDYVEALSNPGLWCLYHGDLGAGITDIALKNGGTQPVAFKDNAGYSVTVTVEATASAAHTPADLEAAKASDPVAAQPPEAPPAAPAAPAPAAAVAATPAAAQPAAAAPAAPAPAAAPSAPSAAPAKPAASGN